MWFATQIEPNAGTIAVGPLPTVCVSVTAGSVGSMRATLLGAIETHTPSGVKATPDGWPASATAWESPVVGSSRKSTAEIVSAIQTAPSPTAIPVGPEPAGSVWVTSLVSPLIRLTVPSPVLVTHTESSSTATPDGAVPTRIVSATDPSSRFRRATTPRSGCATHRLPKPIALAPVRWPSSVASSRLPSSAFRRATEFDPSWLSRSSEPSSGIEMATSASTSAIAPTNTQRLEVHRLCGRRRGEGPQPLHGILALGHDAHDRDGVRDALERQRAAVHVPDAVQPSREMGDLARSEDLAGSCLAAEASGQVQRPSSVAALNGDRFAGVEPDPHGERQLRLFERLVDEPLLKIDRRHGWPRGQTRRRRGPHPRGARAACHHVPR